MTAIDLRRFPLFALLVWTWCGSLIPDYPIAGLVAWAAMLGWQACGGRVWVAACAVGLGAGAAWMHAATPLLTSHPEVRCTVKVCSLVKTSDKHHRFEAKVTAGWEAAAGCIVRCWTPVTGPKPAPGDRLGLMGRSAAPQPGIVPGAFDAKQYYRQQGWSASLFADSAVLLQPAGLRDAPLRTLQAHCTERLTKHLCSPIARQLLPALVLGNRNSLEPELRAAFSASGAMHVLAVSGMHLGLVFVLLKWCLKWIRGRRWLRCAVLLAGTWAFALVTGGAVSTVRAALLLSAVLLADAWHRPRHTLHLLAGCAWLQLLHCPTVWTEVGFQLSYAAVAGIVLLEPALKSKHWRPPCALRPVCGLVRVACAAQLATTPFALLHFHQFPTWFLMSSLLVVPAATLLLAGGLALLASAGTSLAPWIASGLDWLCEAVGWTVGATSELPRAVLFAPAWSGTATCLWLLGLALFWRWRRRLGISQLRPLVVMLGLWACVMDVRDAKLPQLAVVADRQGWQLLTPAHAQVIWRGHEVGEFTTSALQQWLGPLKPGDIKNAPDARRMESGFAVVSWVEDRQRCSVALITEPVGPEGMGTLRGDAVVCCVHLPLHMRKAWQAWCDVAGAQFWPAASGRAWLSSGSAAPG
ncbi:MAG: ComEC/Rec2 family competence protein [Flavobacteriales bacterium]